MRVVTSWLKDYVELPDSVDTLSNHLTQIGLEVDDLSRPSNEVEGVLTATVKRVKPHPENDELYVCELKATDRTAQVVTAASGVIEGNRYIWAPSGSNLPGDTVTSQRFDGIESDGMLCSVRELGFSDQARHLLTLPEDVPAGKDIVDVLDLDDVILELDLTPNRSDCLSYLGIARDYSSSRDLELSNPVRKDPSDRKEMQFEIKIEDPDDCSAYLGLPIDKVTIDSAPLDIQKRLIKMGVQPRNNVVDFTNYVLLELGHPMHAFDRDRLDAPITVRRAKQNETLRTLDGNQRELEDEELLITDDNGPVALAGVMGGDETAVTQDTQNILLESAYFTPTTVRQSSQNQKLHTEASHRFERGVDPQRLETALNRFTELLLDDETQDNTELYKTIRADHRTDDRPSVTFSPDEFENLIGFTPGPDEMERRLESLGCEIYNQDYEWSVQIPSWRHDLGRPEDLIEEILRLGGYENIPSDYPTLTIDTAPEPETNLNDLIRKYLTSHGFTESVTFSFISESEHNFVENGSPHKIENPLSSENESMRQSILDGLTSVVESNVAAGSESVRVFEIGHIFPAGSKDEPSHLGLTAHGPIYSEQWDDYSRNIDYLDVKGLAVTLLLKLGFEEITVKPDEHVGFRENRSGSILLGSEHIGRIGEVKPDLMDAELEAPLVAFDLDLSNLPEPDEIQFEEFSDQPFVNRDLDLVVDDNQYIGELKQTIFDSSRWLEDLTLFDIYYGEPLPEDKKSVSFNLHFRKKDTTLKDDEVNEVQENILNALRDQYGAYLREE